jgi:hypothetical protein
LILFISLLSLVTNGDNCVDSPFVIVENTLLIFNWLADNSLILKILRSLSVTITLLDSTIPLVIFLYVLIWLAVEVIKVLFNANPWSIPLWLTIFIEILSGENDNSAELSTFKYNAVLFDDNNVNWVVVFSNSTWWVNILSDVRATKIGLAKKYPLDSSNL